MALPEVQRKLAAIFYADVAGYSRLTGADEEGTHRTLSASLDAMTAAIHGHGGQVLHYAGDAILAEFASVFTALGCAVEFQRDIAERHRDVPEDRRLHFRIGVNLGDVIVDRDELYGDGVNIAARLESLAEPGGVCISGAVYDQVRAKMPLQYRSLGDQDLKNIAEPIRAYQVRPAPEPAAEAEVEAEPPAEPEEDPSFYRWTGVIAVVVVLAGIAAMVWSYSGDP
jgi:adenylate cyclase